MIGVWVASAACLYILLFLAKRTCLKHRFAQLQVWASRISISHVPE